MAGLHQCPLDSRSFIESINKNDRRMKLGHVMKIENHISTSNCLRHPQLLKDFVFGGSIEGCTPLLLACCFGSLDVVKHIVENWGVDVGTAGNFYLSLLRSYKLGLDIMIEKATPLFVAAFNGHLSIVQYLVEKGANFSTKTSCRSCLRLDGLTALHAPFRFQPESYPDPYWETHEAEKMVSNCCAIVRFLLQSGADPSALPSDGFPIWISPLCDFEVTTELINHGMDVKQRCSNGQTMMHHWSSLLLYCDEGEETTAIVKLLLEKGADPMARDEEGLTPILVAASASDGDVRLGPNNLKVLDFLLERDDIELEEKIQAMELAGASIILGSTENDQQFEKAFGYWRRAQQLRNSETDGSNPLSKTPLNLRNRRTLEWITSQDLENLIQHPSKYRIQSYLIQLRILFSQSSGFFLSGLGEFLFICYSELKHELRFAELLDILWVVLETINCYKLHDIMKISVAKDIIATISALDRNADPLLNVTTIKTTLELILASETSHFEENQHLFKLVTIVAKYPLIIQSKQDILDPLSKLVHRDGGNQIGRTLLHLALTARKKVHSLATVDLLLKAKANPDAVDDEGNAPLHLLYLLKQDLGDSIARLLLDAGAHFDRVNHSGKTAKDLWIEFTSRKRTEDQGALQWNDLPSWIRDTVPHLKCLSARVVRVHRLPFKHLPVTLHPFIKKH